jgi:hypothetical protein
LRGRGKARKAGRDEKAWNEAETCEMSVHGIMSVEQTSMSEFQPGDRVILTAAPASLLRGLPKEDRQAIRSIVGQPVMLAGFSYGQAELEFKDPQGDDHTIWVETALIRAA